MPGQSLGDRSGPRTVKEPSQYTSLRRGSPNVPKAYGTKLHRRPAISNSYHPQDSFARTTFPRPGVQFGRSDNDVDGTSPRKRKSDLDLQAIRDRKLQQINNHIRDPGYSDPSAIRARRTLVEADMPTVGTSIKGAGAWDAPVVNFSVSRIQIGDNAHNEPGMELEIYHPNKNPSIPRQWKLNSCHSVKAVFGEKDVEAVRYAPMSGELFVLLSRTDRASRTLAINGKRISNLNKVVYTVQGAPHSSIENLFEDLKKHDQAIEAGLINAEQANSLRTGPGILIKTLGKVPEPQNQSPSPNRNGPQPISEGAFFGSRDVKDTNDSKKSEEPPNSEDSVIMSETPERLKSLSSTTRRASLSEWSARPPKERELVRATRSQTGALAKTDQDAPANTAPQSDDAPKEVLPEPFEFKFKDSKPVTVTPADFERLEEGEFMNDTMVNFYLKYLHDKLADNQPETAQSTFIFNTFFYEKLTQAGGGYESVKKWTSKIDLFQMKHVIVPIHSKMHWYVAIIYNLPSILRIAQKEQAEQTAQSEQTEQQEDAQLQMDTSESATNTEDNKNDDDDDVALIKQPKPTDVPVRILRNGKTEVLQPKSPKKRRIHDVEEQPCIFILDSLRASGASNSIRILKDYIVSEAWDKKQLKIDRDLIAGSSPRTPQQTNYCDCGVYVIHYVERFLRRPKLFAGLMVDRTGHAKKELENGWGIEKLNKKREVLRNTLLRLRKRQLALNESPNRQNGTANATVPTKSMFTSSMNSVDGGNEDVPSGATSTSSTPGPDGQGQDDDDDEDVVVIDYVSHK